jgi:alkylation response protein AidB-like acyl-CoA dehydrogenase
VELEFTDEQEELRSSVRSFLEKECPVEAVRAVVETGEAPEKLWGSMVALDWPALAVSEEYGGIGLTILETAVVVEELGRAIAPGPLLATVTQFAPVVREVGTPEQQQQRFLSGVASGALAGTVALADHPRAWALDDVTMTAEPAEGGWLLTGVKFGVLAADGTTEVVVVARVGDDMGAFVIPAAEAGLSPVQSLDASRPLSEATLDHVFVPHDRALGEPDSAASTLGIARALQEATVGLALETVGTCDALFQLLLAYIKERKQFGVPIGSFQAIKHKMSNMFLAIERARALCYFAVAAINEDTPNRATAK